MKTITGIALKAGGVVMSPEPEPEKIIPFRHLFKHEYVITAKDIRIELVAILTGIPLVDLSIEWETHLVRGTQ